MTDPILLTHAQKYPLMEPRDAVKLLYQRNFGGGHLIPDEAACLDFLQQEYTNTPQTGGPLLEEIGNGMVRVMLSALDVCGYLPDQLGQDFIRSAASVQGDPKSFLQSLSMLAEMTRQGLMPFSSQALDSYLTEYTALGYPAVSHSEVYRNTYHPAYRVLHTDHIPDKIKKQV